MRRALLLALLLVAGCVSPQPDFSALVRTEAAAVVRIGAVTLPPAREYSADPEDEEALDELFSRLPLPDGPMGGPTLGSGFLISDDGFIVTNAHLVEAAYAGAVIVRLADRREFKARVIGADPVSDIALLKIDAARLPAVRLGDPSRLQPGQWVAAIGSPLGLERSVSAGIVSAVGRTLPEESYLPFIQTDVAINPGNSGGPLFNMRGEVVGVNSVIYSVTGGFMGVAFAVPIDVAMKVAAELKRNGKVTRGRIGVRLQDLTPELAQALRVPGGAGALIVDTLADGPAADAGLRSADVVVSFGGAAVKANVELMDLVARARPGDKVETGYVRDGRVQRTQVVVGEARGAPLPREPVRTLADPAGLLVVPLERARRERLGGEGVLVRHAEGAAQRAGISPGDIILSVNGVPAATPYGFYAQLAAAAKSGSVALLVQRDGARSFVALQLPD